jgi:hypothetical protein
MELTEDKLLKIVLLAIDIGKNMKAVDLAAKPQCITRKQAEVLHSRKTIDKWVQDQKIEIIYRGKRQYFDRIRLDAVAAISYFN